MSTRLMKPGERESEAENSDERNEPTLEPSQPSATSAEPRPNDGKKTTPVMTEAETADLLARLQDILSLWKGSDNRIMGNFVMTVFPIPEGMKIEKVLGRNGHDKAYSVNGVPVVNISGHDTGHDKEKTKE